jgi:hypothetical protein
MSMGIEFGKMSGAGGLTEGFERLRESRDSLIKPNDIGGSSPAEGASFGDKKLEEVAAGRNKDLHGAVLSMEKADVDFRMLTQVRNKVIEAYREVMRMQI